MGIDNDVKLFFGTCLDYEEAERIASSYGLSLEDMLWEERKDGFVKEFPDLYLGYASPYYDSCLDDAAIYLSIGSYSDSDSFSIDEITKLLEGWKDSSYMTCLEKFNIDPNEPAIIALPHIY